MTEENDSNSGHHDVHCSEKNCYAAGHGFGRDDGKPYCRVHMSDHMKEPPKSKNEGNGMQMMGKATPTFMTSEVTNNSFRLLKFFGLGGTTPTPQSTQAAHEARTGQIGPTSFPSPGKPKKEEEEEEWPGGISPELVDVYQNQQHQQNLLTEGGQEGVTGPMGRFQSWNARREPDWATELGTRLRGS